MPVRPIGVGALRKAAEKGGFRAVEGLGVQSEIIDGGGLDAVDFSSERDSVEIFREDFALGMELFHFPRFGRLDEFGFEGTLSGAGDGDELHGDGRGAGDDASIGEILPCRAGDGLQVDAVVVVEMRVFRRENDVDGLL